MTESIFEHDRRDVYRLSIDYVASSYEYEYRDAEYEYEHEYDVAGEPEPERYTRMGGTAGTASISNAPTA